MKKTEVAAQIETFIDDGNNTAEQFRDFQNIALDYVDGTMVRETYLTQEFTTKAGTSITYALYFTRIGEVVRMEGVITNTTGSDISVAEVLTFAADTIYTPETSLPWIFVGVQENSGLAAAAATFSIESAGLILIGTLKAGISVYVGRTYEALN